MSSHKEFNTLEEVCAGLETIQKSLDSRDELDRLRRIEDDRRELSASKAREELMTRVDAHGKRTTQLETKWEAFFGEQGAFRIVVKKGDEHDKKLDRLFWLVAVGVGILVAAQHFWK